MDIRNPDWPWYAIRARTSTEKTATELLQFKGYECFLPLRRSRRRWSDRVKEVEEPLFPGYFFCRFDLFNRLPILKTPGVFQIVGMGKTPIPVADDEIAALQRVGKNGLATQPWPFLEAGQIARIEYGPLRGLAGIIVNIKSESKLVLSIGLLHRSVAIEIDRDWLGGPHPASGTVLAIEPNPSMCFDPSQSSA
jgi:transcription antitermination factor NusG